jgi:hypothetical protein
LFAGAMIPVKEKEKRSFNSKNHKGMISWLLSLSLSPRFILRALGGSKKGLKLYTSSQTAFFIRTISFL